MMEQLEEVCRSHNGALHKLEEQERNHKAFIRRSNWLVTLQEEDRERFVHQNPEVQMNAEAKKQTKTHCYFIVPTKLAACNEAKLVEISIHDYLNPS